MGINYGQGDENEPSKGYQLYFAALVMVLIAALFVAARLGTRFSNKKVGIDDYMITASLVRFPPHTPYLHANGADISNRYAFSMCLLETVRFVNIDLGFFDSFDSDHQSR